MKASELRAKTYQELCDLLNELGRELMNLNFQKTLGQLKKPHLVREVQKNIARVKTVMHQMRAYGKQETCSV